MPHYWKQLLGIAVKPLAKAPFVIWPLQLSRASEWSTAGAGSCTHFNTGLGYHGSICSHLPLCGTTRVQGEGEIQIQLEQYQHLPPFPTVRTTIHTHKTADDALIIETPGVIQVEFNQYLYEPWKGTEKSTKESLVTVIPKYSTNLHRLNLELAAC